MDNTRFEFKYLIDVNQLETLKMRLPSIMTLDPHVGTTGKYEIRSLYFDDYYNSCFYDNENGVDPREKFRIRIYNGSAERIRLELKRKESGKTKKISCPISGEQVQRLISGKRLKWQGDMNPLLRRLYILQETRLMYPKVIVEYDRTPFVYRDGNVRLTLDLNIRASSDIDCFLDKSIISRPAMPIGHNLLEVKYDELLPDHIYRTAQMDGLRQITFSKYYLCRKVGGLQ